MFRIRKGFDEVHTKFDLMNAKIDKQPPVIANRVAALKWQKNPSLSADPPSARSEDTLTNPAKRDYINPDIYHSMTIIASGDRVGGSYSRSNYNEDQAACSRISSLNRSSEIWISELFVKLMVSTGQLSSCLCGFDFILTLGISNC